MKGKLFRKPDIFVTLQELLEGKKRDGGLVVDVGANVGMASFVAAVMGFKVLAFEPVMENLQRICDGIWFNRVGELMTVFEAAASDHVGNITFYKLVGRLDNSAISASGAKLAFKSNEEVAVQVLARQSSIFFSWAEGFFLRSPDISVTLQELLEGKKRDGGLVVDVGANVGMASFAAAVMGFKVLAFGF
ncbi:hypothetical protein LINPERHAP1_LOCUS31131 [Linum perenne]